MISFNHAGHPKLSFLFFGWVVPITSPIWLSIIWNYVIWKVLNGTNTNRPSRFTTFIIILSRKRHLFQKILPVTDGPQFWFISSMSIHICIYIYICVGDLCVCVCVCVLVWYAMGLKSVGKAWQSSVFFTPSLRASAEILKDHQIIARSFSRRVRSSEASRACLGDPATFDGHG